MMKVERNEMVGGKVDVEGGGWSLVEFDWLKRAKFGGFVELSWWSGSTMAAGVPLKDTAPPLRQALCLALSVTPLPSRCTSDNPPR